MNSIRWGWDHGFPLTTHLNMIALMPDMLPKIALDTSKGRLEVVLYENVARVAVASLLDLAESGFYNGMKFFSPAPQMKLHFGRNDQGEGAGYQITQQVPRRNHFDAAGRLGLAGTGADNGSDFFLALEAMPHLDEKLPAIGQIVSGLDVLQQLGPGDQLRAVKVLRGAPASVDFSKTVTREETVRLSRS